MKSKQHSSRLQSTSAAASPDGVLKSEKNNLNLSASQPGAMKDLIHHAFLRKHLQLVDNKDNKDNEETENRASFKNLEKAESSF
jgi:hypothetical protein